MGTVSKDNASVKINLLEKTAFTKLVPWNVLATDYVIKELVSVTKVFLEMIAPNSFARM